MRLLAARYQNTALNPPEDFCHGSNGEQGSENGKDARQDAIHVVLGSVEKKRNPSDCRTEEAAS